MTGTLPPHPAAGAWRWLAGSCVAVGCAALGSAAVLLQVPPALALACAAVPGGLLLVVLLLDRPRLAVLLAAFVLLLPEGLLPPAGSLLRLALLGLACLAWLRCSLRRPGPVVIPLPMVLLVLFFTWTVATVSWAERPSLAVTHLVALAIVLTLTFLLLNTTTTKADVDAFMRMLACVGWVLVVAGILTLVTSGVGEGRLQVQDTNANQYGNALLLSCVGVLWVDAARARRDRFPVAASAFLCAVAALVGLSASRGSLLTFVVLLLGLWVARGTRRTAGTTIVLCLLLVATIGPLIFAATFARVRTPEPDQPSRTTLWAAGLELVADQPVRGVGAGNGPRAMPPYVNERSERDFFPKGKDSLPAHNPFVEVAVETGIVGVLLFASALVSAATLFVRRLLHLRRTSGQQVSGQTAAVAASTAAFLLVWIKSGGLGAHPTTYTLVVLWLVGATAAVGPRDPGPASDVFAAATPRTP